MRTLVTGGIRSGKSALAENLLGADATYVATAPGRDDDPDWAARIRDHRARRPASWRTVETSDLPGALAALTGDQRTTLTRLQAQRELINQSLESAGNSTSGDDPKIQAWTSLAQSLINLKEFIYLR